MDSTVRAPSLSDLTAVYGSDTLDLGADVRLTWLVNGDGWVTGFIRDHPRARETQVAGACLPAGSLCQSNGLLDVSVNRRVNRYKWRVLAWQPLTLAPSLRCRVCGHHGFVRGGRWVPTP